MENADSNNVGAFEGTMENPVLFTDAAIDAAKKAIQEEGDSEDGLRVSVMGGGCSGLKYSLDFEKEERMGDTVLDFSGLKVFVDAVSIKHLIGTTVDFIAGLNGTGFKFHNPNAVRTCGCGHSFS